MVTPDPFRRPPDGSLPRELPRNSLQLRILRITPLVTGFYARNYILDKPEEKANNRN